MNGDPDAEGGPEVGDGAVPDEFDAIVAAWRREGHVPVWPDADELGPAEPTGPPVDVPPTAERPATADPPPAADPTPTVGPPAPAPSAPPTRPNPPQPAATWPPPAALDDEHFVPPEPPPLPRLGPPALVGLALLGLGLVLVVAPSWVGVSTSYGLPLGLLALASGLGWLVLRLWPDPPGHGGDGGDDDGAVV